MLDYQFYVNLEQKKSILKPMNMSSKPRTKHLCLVFAALAHAALLQGQCVQTLSSSQHPPQADCLIG